jgi:hypothetical protein
MPLTTKSWDSFAGGRCTRNNLLRATDDHFLIASNLIFPGDGVAHKRPGYTLVKASPFAGVRRIYNFNRQSDQTPFVFLAGAGKLGWMSPTGVAYTQLSSAEDANAIFDFIDATAFEAYCSNGLASYRLVDVGGTLTKYNWGIAAPAAAPTIGTAGGSLTLVYGRTYAFSYVAKWTDSTGVQRVHVGPPSPISAFSGAVASGVVNLSVLTASADPQVTHIWIWATNDTPQATTSALFFAAEIPNGTTTWGDSLADTSLDTTRLIPYDNQPAPLATILKQYQGRIVAMGIPGKPDLVMMSALSECPLGIAQQCFPLSVFFNVPGGVKDITAGEAFNGSFYISTQDWWFQITGSTADTITENDRIFGPGAVGPRATCVMANNWLCWVGVDKKVWAWDGTNAPSEVSWKIARRDGSGMLAMEDLGDATLKNSELRIYSFGRYSILAHFASTGANPGYFDWVQLYDVTALTAPAGPWGTVTKDGRLTRGAESDMFPSHQMYASGNVMVGATQYLFMADLAGNIYRWPDGFADAGTNFTPQLGSEFDAMGGQDIPENALKRMRWLDLKSSRQDAATAFSIQAVATDGANLTAPLLKLPTRAVPAPRGNDPTVLRAYLEQVRGASFGRLLRWLITFPTDANDCELYEVIGKASAIADR